MQAGRATAIHVEASAILNTAIKVPAPPTPQKQPPTVNIAKHCL